MRKKIGDTSNDVYAKRNYMLYLREFTSNVKDPNMKSLFYYRLSDKNFIETKMKSVIEVPFERNGNIETITFQVKTIFTDEEINCQQTFELPELAVTEAEPYKSFCIKFFGSGGKFFLIFFQKTRTKNLP